LTSCDDRKPFFLYLPFSLGHIPNLLSSEFKGKSRIGNYGVGEMADLLQRLNETSDDDPLK
jgi:hypothetical protein